MGVSRSSSNIHDQSLSILWLYFASLLVIVSGRFPLTPHPCQQDGNTLLYTLEGRQFLLLGDCDKTLTALTWVVQPPLNPQQGIEDAAQRGLDPVPHLDLEGLCQRRTDLRDPMLGSAGSQIHRRL